MRFTRKRNYFNVTREQNAATLNTRLHHKLHEFSNGPDTCSAASVPFMHAFIHQTAALSKTVSKMIHLSCTATSPAVLIERLCVYYLCFLLLAFVSGHHHSHHPVSVGGSSFPMSTMFTHTHTRSQHHHALMRLACDYQSKHLPLRIWCIWCSAEVRPIAA